VSWKARSTLALDNITPVTPPARNNTKNANANNTGTPNLNLPPIIRANHEKILIPRGTAIIIVALVK